MIPVIFRIPLPGGGELPLYSYGLLLAISFLVGRWLLLKEFTRKGLDSRIADNIVFYAFLAGIAGSKIFSLFESWDYFLTDPLDVLFSGQGLVFHGGLILGTAVVIYYAWKKKVALHTVADLAAPLVALCYAIGRIGCFVSGDGCYGIPTTSSLGMTFENGVSSTLSAQNPHLAAEFMKLYPDLPVPENIAVFPTPLFETISMFLVFLLLWSIRKRGFRPWVMFAMYLFFAGVERLLVEFIRLNPVVAFGLSEAQVVSILMIIASIIIISIKGLGKESANV